MTVSDPAKALVPAQAPDPVQDDALFDDPDSLDVGTTSSGIAADNEGSIYSADVAAHNLRKYIKVR